MSTSTTRPKILVIGLDPTSPLPQQFRDFFGSPSDIDTKIKDDMRRVHDAGYDATVYFLKPADAQAGLDWIEAKLKAEKFRGILIGTGLRMVPENTVLFEKAVNIVMREGKGGVLIFNDGLGRNADAVLRNKESLAE